MRTAGLPVLREVHLEIGCREDLQEGHRIDDHTRITHLQREELVPDLAPVCGIQQEDIVCAQEVDQLLLNIFSKQNNKK